MSVFIKATVAQCYHSYNMAHMGNIKSIFRRESMFLAFLMSPAASGHGLCDIDAYSPEKVRKIYKMRIPSPAKLDRL